jgi:hypothetical protein
MKSGDGPSRRVGSSYLDYKEAFAVASKMLDPDAMLEARQFVLHASAADDLAVLSDPGSVANANYLSGSGTMLVRLVCICPPFAFLRATSARALSTQSDFLQHGLLPHRVVASRRRFWEWRRNHRSRLRRRTCEHYRSVLVALIATYRPVRL